MSNLSPGFKNVSWRHMMGGHRPVSYKSNSLKFAFKPQQLHCISSMMIIYVAWNVEVLESAGGSAQSHRAWGKWGMVVKPHTPSTPHSQALRIDFLSWFSPTESVCHACLLVPT